VIVNWLRKLFFRRESTPPPDSLHSVAERALVVDALSRIANVMPSTHLVGPIAIAARRYVLAIQRHHDDGDDSRKTKTVERQLWAVLCKAVEAVPGTKRELAPVIAHDICLRFSAIEVRS
jgi:hypothetical protein